MSPPAELVELGEALARLDLVNPLRLAGRVSEVTGLVVRATIPGVRVGELVFIDTTRPRRRRRAPSGRGGRLPRRGGRADAARRGGRHRPRFAGDADRAPAVDRRGRRACWGACSTASGNPIDGAGPLGAPAPTGRSTAPRRRRCRAGASGRPLSLGVRAIDALLTVGEGQRLGLFAGSGVGKSTLLGQIARHTDADVNVICLVGERGREVVDFLDESLGPAGRARSVVVCATSDAPSLVRLKSAFVATAIAEWFRDQGRRVLFMMDSLTRFARAQREVGLAAGEPPARQGYPPSVFALLPRLLERTGNGARGLDHRALHRAGRGRRHGRADRRRGARHPRRPHRAVARSPTAGHWPAIDVLPSLSRLMTAVADAPHRAAAARLRELLAAYERHRDLILLGAYQRGSDRRTDDAIARIDAIDAFLKKKADEAASLLRHRPPGSWTLTTERTIPGEPHAEPIATAHRTDTVVERQGRLPLLQDPRRSDPRDHRLPRRARARLQGHRPQGAAAPAGDPARARRDAERRRRPRTRRCWVT